MKAIKETIYNKLVHYIDKTKSRYKLIKDFNSKKVIEEKPRKNKSPAQKLIQTSINDMIS